MLKASAERLFFKGYIYIIDVNKFGVINRSEKWMEE